MAKRVQIVGNTTAGTAAFAGRAREITVDTSLNELAVHTGGGANTHKRIPNKDTNDSLYQALSSLLTAFAGLSATGGIPAKTGAATVAVRTMTGTTHQVTVTNGDGASGNPTFSIPDTVDLSRLTATQLVDVQGLLVAHEVHETVGVNATGITNTTNFDMMTQATYYDTSNAAGNFTLNIRGNASTSLNDRLAVGESITLTLLTTQGGTPYYLTHILIDGTNQTINWLNSAAPSAGVAGGFDVYTINIIKTASATYTVFAALSSYGT